MSRDSDRNTSARPAGFGHGPGRGPQSALVQKPKNMKATLKRLLKYMHKRIPLILLVFIIAIIGTGMRVITPKILGNGTTLIFDGIASTTGIDFRSLATILGCVAALYVGQSITGYLQQWIMTVVSQRTSFDLRNNMKDKMNRVPISFFDKNSNGNLMSIAINDMDNIATNLQQSLTQLISSIIFVIGIFAVMLTISWQLTLIAMIMIPGSIMVAKIITPRVQKNYREYLKLQGELNGHIEETINGHLVVKSFNGQQAAIEKFEQYNSRMYETGWKAKFIGASTMPSMMVIRNFTYVIIAVAGAVKVATGSIRIGDMQAFLQYSTQFSQPISQFTQIWNGILSTIASAERVFAVLDAEDMPEYKTEFPNRPGEHPKIAFDRVAFSYTDDPLLTNFTMNVDDGQMVAIVGHTGAGKSTLINLMERFYEIDGGSIRINGQDIRNIDRHTLRGCMGMVLQETWLFSGTIYDNIRYGNENATEEQIYAAARAAYVDDFVRRLPEGYHTVLNEEASNISQGQRQLITIARAFVANPEILILDEATSNVDSRTEMLIQKAMRRLLKGRTSFVVAHRLSTIYDADCIVVMEHGDIAEIGTHRELLDNKGTYYDIYNSQFAQDYELS